MKNVRASNLYLTKITLIRVRAYNVAKAKNKDSWTGCTSALSDHITHITGNYSLILVLSRKITHSPHLGATRRCLKAREPSITITARSYGGAQKSKSQSRIERRRMCAARPRAWMWASVCDPNHAVIVRMPAEQKEFFPRAISFIHTMRL